MALSMRRFLVPALLATNLAAAHTYGNSAKVRTVVTTDLEQDDLASLIRYLLYTNEIETQGLVYSSSKWHWAGNGNATSNGTLFYHPNREYDVPERSWRWTGNTTIQDVVIPAYAEVYPNLVKHDPSYPTPEYLQSITKFGNIAFEGDDLDDTEGSDLIKSLLLDDDPRPLYLQAWGGVNTISRALKSIEKQYAYSRDWLQIRNAVSRKAVILASGFQDDVYGNYVAPFWPKIRVENFDPGYNTWAYNCNRGKGNQRGLPDAHYYYTGPFIKAHIEIGPYGRLYRSWLDGQKLAGDPEDVFGSLATANATDLFCKPLEPYAFLSEGDNVVFNPLIPTGIEVPTNPKLGSWGGRAVQNSTFPELWTGVSYEKNQTGSNEVAYYSTDRWAAAAWTDFAARMQWTLTPKYEDGNHAPTVTILNGSTVEVHAGTNVTLAGGTSDPDQGQVVTTHWWQYFEEGTYPGTVTVTEASSGTGATVSIPSDAKAGQTISIILQGTDNGEFPLTRYDRVMLLVV